MYDRNIDEDGEYEVCKGIFRMWNTAEGSLVKIVKKLDRVSVYVKNNIAFLLQSI